MADERPSLQELIAQAASGLNAGPQVPTQAPQGTRMQQMARRMAPAMRRAAQIYGPRYRKWVQDNPQAVQSFLAAMGLTPQSAVRDWRHSASGGFPVTRPGDQTFKPGMDPQQAQQQIGRNFSEREREKAMRRAQMRTPGETEMAQARMKPLGVLAQVMAQNNPVGRAAQLPDIMSTPVAADEAPSAETQMKLELKRLNEEIEKLKKKRDRDLKNSGVRSERDNVTKAYQDDVGPLNRQKAAIENQLNFISSSRSESEKGWKETASQAEKDFWYRDAPLYTGGASAVLGALTKNPLTRYGLNTILGGAEGTLAALQPQFHDMHLPPTSPAKQQADKNWRNPDFWLTEVAPEAGQSALYSLVGAGMGGKVRQGAEGIASTFGRGPKVPNAPTANVPAVTPRQNLRMVETPRGRRFQYPSGHWAPREAVEKASPQKHKDFLARVAKEHQMGPPHSADRWPAMDDPRYTNPFFGPPKKD
jgi:hypothetical protein